MPAKTKKQLAYIYALRNKYGSFSKTPKKHQWVWGEEWGSLKEKNSSHVLTWLEFTESL